MGETNEGGEANRLGAINPLFRDAAFKLALALGIVLEEDAKKTSRWFRAGVCGRYRDAIFARLSRHKLTDLTEIALRVKIHRSVLSRWNSGEASPDTDTLLFAGTAAKVEWSDALPNTGATITAGICEAVSAIRTEILSKDAQKCDLAVLALMRYVSFGTLWLRAELSQDDRLLARAASDAQSYVSQRLGRAFTASHDEMHRMITEWRDAYLLFHLLIPFDWPM